MFLSLFGAVESGLMYAIMALGVYLSFRILDFPDLTVDGSFVTGGAVAAVSIMNGISPIIATLLGAIAGFIAGVCTGLLHTKGKISNLRTMGSSQISLLQETTLESQIVNIWEKTGIDQIINGLFQSMGIERVPTTWGILFFMIIVIIVIKLLIDYYLKTEFGLALRATGDNQRMIRSFSANTDNLIIVGIGLANGLVALAGAIIAQSSGFADVGMGIGMIIIGLASVIIGEALFGVKTIARATLAVVFGAIVYRFVVTLALRSKFLETGDMKLITAVLVIIALITPKIIQSQREKKRRREKQAQLEAGEFRNA